MRAFLPLALAGALLAGCSFPDAPCTDELEQARVCVCADEAADDDMDADELAEINECGRLIHLLPPAQTE